MNHFSPLVSVILPAYNGGPYLKDAIQSVLKQTFSDLELIIVDDGSYDGSSQAIDSFSDPRIRRAKHEKNLGIVKAFNTGLEMARGKYIVRMDADDVSLPQRIARQVRFMDENPGISMAGSWIRTFGSGQSVTMRFPASPAAVENALLLDNVISAPSLIFRAADIAAKKLVYANSHRYENEYAFYASAVMAGLKVANIPEALVEKRVHKEQMSNFFETRVKGVEDMQIQKSYFSFLLRKLRFLDPRYLSNMLRFAYLRVYNKLALICKDLILRKKEFDFYRIPFAECFHSGCTDERLDDSDVVDMVTVAFNNLDVMRWQIRLVPKYVKDAYFYTVCDNSSDVSISDEIRKLCIENNIAYVRLPKNPFTRAASHGAALNWICRHYISKRGAKYFGFIDHDIFPTKETSLKGILKKQPVYGYIQERQHIWYLWNGFCFFRRSDIPIHKMNFQDRPVEGVPTDSGGMNWPPIYSRIDRNKIIFAPSWYEQIRKPKNPTQKLVDMSLDHVEHIDDWVHIFSSSGWKKMRDQEERYEAVRRLLEGFF